MTMHTKYRVEEQLLLALCLDSKTEYAISVSSAIAKHDPLGIPSMPNPVLYKNARDFRLDYCISKLLSKWKGWTDQRIDPTTTALDTWKVCENQNEATNRRLRDHRFSPGKVLSSPGCDVRYEILHLASEKISKILGKYSTKVLASMVEEAECTNGATFDLKRGTSLAKKLSTRLSCTATALPYLRAMIESDPDWASCFTKVKPEGPFRLIPSKVFKLVNGNKHTTVPKTFKTDRNIAIEPTGNIMLQRGVGLYIRSRLKRVGVGLDDQSVNQRLASAAHRLALSTIDLSSASDTLSSELVWLLLPHDWAVMLNDLRSQYTRVNGVWERQHKFSSMGNGFTFELETLIFYALAFACAKKFGYSDFWCNAYGDDIIVPNGIYDNLVDILQYVGFSVNTEKSYKEGPFFESCGKHYFEGVDVTPIYQKDIVEGMGTSSHIRFTNRLIRWTRASGRMFTGQVGKLLRTLQPSKKEIESGRIAAIPIWCGHDDGYLVDVRWLPRWDRNHGYYCRVLLFQPKVAFERRHGALYAYRLRKNVSSVDPKGRPVHTIAKDGVWKLKWTYVQQFSHDTYTPTPR